MLKYAMRAAAPTSGVTIALLLSGLTLFGCQQSPRPPVHTVRVGLYDYHAVRQAFPIERASGSALCPVGPENCTARGPDPAEQARRLSDGWHAIVARAIKQAIPAVAQDAQVDFLVSSDSYLPPDVQTVDLTEKVIARTKAELNRDFTQFP